MDDVDDELWYCEKEVSLQNNSNLKISIACNCTIS